MHCGLHVYCKLIIRSPYFLKSNIYYTFTVLIEIPTWLAKAKTLLLPKNDQTNQAKNYRNIALQNIILRLYKSRIDHFLREHCQRNNIITTEAVGGKNEVWGCFKQLLVNKIILEEVTENRHSLIRMWLDHQRAFDSVPHKWLIKALELAKVP